MKSRLAQTSLEQLAGILSEFGITSSTTPHEIFMEIITLLPGQEEDGKLLMRPTKEDNNKRFYNHGCDTVTMQFEKEYLKQIKIKN